ncbi:MAG: TonB-dependent receptor [Bacteroidales bacterium]|nr:TonB-dependent receptor [Bacteroidales bacterium]
MVLVSGSLAFAQNRSISGTVVDGAGVPIIGATVMVVGNNSIGAVTNADGAFTLSVPAGANIAVSCIGYATQTVAVGNQTVFSFILEEDTEFLEETVVIGYGVQRKSDLTGSVASVSEADFTNRSTSDAAAALMGKAAGIQILTSSGAPGAGSSIRVRGYSSNSGNIGPLLIVDGLKVDNIQYLDPEMIESMEILKDAASAAIYGAEAGNGVVLITTKTGKGVRDGRVFYNNQFSLSTLAHPLDVMNAEEYIAFGKDYGWLSDSMLQSINYNGADVNWGDEIFEPTWNSRHTLGFQGGNDRGNLFISLNNVSNDGIFAGNKDNYKRLSVQVNADYKIKSWLTVSSNTSIEKWSTHSVSQHSDNGSAFLAAVTSSPLEPARGSYEDLTLDMQAAINNGIKVLKDAETGLYWTVSRLGETQGGSPFVRRDADNSTSEGLNIRGTLAANLTPFKGLVYTSRFGYRINQSNSHSFTEPYYCSPFIKADLYSISAGNNTGRYYQWENFANYNTTIARKHSLGLMAGMSYIESNNDNISTSASGADILTGYEPNFQYMSYLLSGDGVTKSISNAPSKSTSLSYFGRLTYSYDNRYSFQANFRADAFDSSKLSKQARWGYFPSFSAGWTISNEPFFRDNVNRDKFNFLKLRASWGRNGNVNVLSNYRYATSISYGSTWYQWNVDSPALSYGSTPSGLANPNLKWETSEQIDLGLDARFLNNRLTLGVDWYKKTTEDLLVNVSLSAALGVSSTTINAGSVENKGLEVELTWKDTVGDFSYSVAGNFSTLKNRVTYLDPTISRIGGTVPQGSRFGTYFETGYPIWYMRGLKGTGVDPATGQPGFEDITGDGVVDTDDFQMIGLGIPDFTYGLTVNLAWKNFDMVIFGNGVYGNEIFPSSWRTDRPHCNTYSWYWNNTWKKAGDNAKFPKTEFWNQDTFSSTYNLFDGSYFKIKQIQLGYTLPRKLVNKIAISSLRVYTSLENFFCFSSYPGLDPETATANSASSIGIDMGTFPTAKQFILGVNLSF